ncbi:MAG: hypothetical protein IAF38_10965, partial [Bacteroidia bacterium]|nr:hypothetical protein [Bacteroidia bacterium]
MKKFNSILSAILLFGMGLIYAQNGNKGIYKSLDDFLKGKVTHSGKHTHIKLHET